MNMLLWVLQGVTALMFGASGVMKIFMIDKLSKEDPSFGALPREMWMALGVLELICVVGLIVPSVFHWKPYLSGVAAAVLALETLVFVYVHIKSGQVGTIVMVVVLGLLMAFIAYGRLVLKPIV